MAKGRALPQIPQRSRGFQLVVHGDKHLVCFSCSAKLNKKKRLVKELTGFVKGEGLASWFYIEEVIERFEGERQPAKGFCQEVYTDR